MRLLRIARWWLPISGSIWSPSEDPSSVPASECSALITLSQLDPVQASDLAWVAAWRRATALAVIRTVDGFVLFDITICHVSRVGLSVRNSHPSWCLDPAFNSVGHQSDTASGFSCPDHGANKNLSAFSYQHLPVKSYLPSHIILRSAGYCPHGCIGHIMIRILQYGVGHRCQSSKVALGGSPGGSPVGYLCRLLSET